MSFTNITEPRNALAMLSVLLILGSLYYEVRTEPFFLDALGSMAGFILFPSTLEMRHSFLRHIFDTHILTLILPFAILCAVIGILKILPQPVSVTGNELVRLSFTIWVCLQFLVLIPLSLRPTIDKWIEEKKNQRFLGHVDKRGSHIGSVVIRVGICNGDQHGTRADA